MIILLFVVIVGLLLTVAYFAPDPFPPSEMEVFLHKLNREGKIAVWWRFEETEDFTPGDYGGKTYWRPSGGIVFDGIVSKMPAILNEPALKSLHDNTYVYGDIDDVEDVKTFDGEIYALWVNGERRK